MRRRSAVFIAVISVLAFIPFLLLHHGPDELKGRGPVTPVRRPQSASAALTSAATAGCLHSTVSAKLVVDDRGFTCPLEQRRSDGCCGAGALYDCAGCSNVSQCCGEQERCISCCMGPQHAHLRAQLYAAAVGHPQYRTGILAEPPAAGAGKEEPEEAEEGGTAEAEAAEAGAEHLLWEYAFCSARCRVTASSVTHENRYRSRGARHCYGWLRPVLELPQRHAPAADTLDGSDPATAGTADAAAAGGSSRHRDTTHEVVGVDVHMSLPAPGPAAGGAVRVRDAVVAQLAAAAREAATEAEAEDAAEESV